MNDVFEMKAFMTRQSDGALWRDCGRNRAVAEVDDVSDAQQGGDGCIDPKWEACSAACGEQVTQRMEPITRLIRLRVCVCVCARLCVCV